MPIILGKFFGELCQKKTNLKKSANKGLFIRKYNKIVLSKYSLKYTFLNLLFNSLRAHSGYRFK